ncbi:MAG TPA: hypothetical protein VLJ14_16040 [Ktedonobacterales bacterium]|nr:hypothetical protein [Ktedonobacterales bacterium]
MLASRDIRARAALLGLPVSYPALVLLITGGLILWGLVRERNR